MMFEQDWNVGAKLQLLLSQEWLRLHISNFLCTFKNFQASRGYLCDSTAFLYWFTVGALSNAAIRPSVRPSVHLSHPLAQHSTVHFSAMAHQQVPKSVGAKNDFGHSRP